jgi:hypothetical protein
MNNRDLYLDFQRKVQNGYVPPSLVITERQPIIRRHNPYNTLLIVIAILVIVILVAILLIRLEMRRQEKLQAQRKV